MSSKVVTINMYDFVLTDNGIKLVEYAKKLQSLKEDIDNVIFTRDIDNPKFGDEERKCLLSDYSVAFKKSYPNLYKTFCQEYVYKILYPYLLEKLKSIHDNLGNARDQLNKSYRFSQQKNDIVLYMNKIYGVYCKFELPENEDLNNMLAYIEKAFGILNKELDIKEDRVEAGHKFIELLTKLRKLLSNILKSMTIEIDID